MRQDEIDRTRLFRIRLGAGIGAAALAATTLAMALAPAADAGQAHTVPTAAQAAPAAQTVTVHVRLPNCPTCSLKMQTAYSYPHVWQSRWQKAKHNAVTFHVSPRQAHGSVFLIKAPWADLYGYEPLVAFHYKGTRVGQQVTNDLAATKHRGTACYIGGDGRLGLTVRTAPFAGRTPPGDPATGIRAWVAHSQEKYGRYLFAEKGSVGTQEIVKCPR